MAVRYSGNLTIRLTVNDRSDGWRVNIAECGANVYRGTVGQPHSARVAIDAPEEYDAAARAALAFAEHDGMDMSGADVGDSGFLVYRSRK